MKKSTIILCLLLAFTFSSKAQSDATKEETEKWLETYGDKLIVTRRGYSVTHIRLNGSSFMLDHLKLNHNRSILKDYTWEVDISKIIKIEWGIENKLVLYSQNNMIELSHDDWNDKSPAKKLNYSSQSITFKDKESMLRFVKAIKHYFSFFKNKIIYIDQTSIQNKF
jgi:hypothetical protein